MNDKAPDLSKMNSDVIRLKDRRDALKLQKKGGMLG